MQSINDMRSINDAHSTNDVSAANQHRERKRANTVSKANHHRIHFLPAGRSAEFPEGTTIREAALQLGIVIESTCAGMGTCGTCQVNFRQGAPSPTPAEREFLSETALNQGVRLACQAALQGESICELPRDTRVFGTGADDPAAGRSRYSLDPDLRKLHFELPLPRSGEKYFYLEQVLAALQPQVDEKIEYDFPVIRDLPALLRSGRPDLTAVLDRRRLLALESGDTRGNCYGIALDLGTTTIAARLLDLNRGVPVAVASALNPQISHGADVITRIDYTVRDPEGLADLQQLAVGQINAMIAELCRAAQIEKDAVYKLVLAGNTVMQHLLLAADPASLARAPYVPGFRGPVIIPAADLGIAIHPNGLLYTLPNLAGYVGGDISAALTVLDLDESDEIQLAVDIGTNGEMVLGSKQRLLCSSSPAGPAWEGGLIEWGMRAAAGAIERAEIRDGDLAIKTIGGEAPRGICGSGLLDLVCAFRRAGVIDASGRIGELPKALAASLPGLQARIRPLGDGTQRIALAENGQETIYLTQKDIREVQLAKSAIAAGITMLMRSLDITAKDIARVYIAGAFGNHLRGRDALDVGLLPAVDESRIRFIGNAALAGAEAVLLSRSARERAEQIADTIEYVAISERRDFQDCFFESLIFP